MVGERIPGAEEKKSRSPRRPGPGRETSKETGVAGPKAVSETGPRGSFHDFYRRW